MRTMITTTNGNSMNRIHGARIRLYTYTTEIFSHRSATVVDEFYVPSMHGAINYVRRHPRGRYGKRWQAMLDLKARLEKQG